MVILYSGPLLFCWNVYLSSFYFKDLFLQEGSFNLARQRQVRGILQGSGCHLRSTRLAHTLSLALGPRAWWKMSMYGQRMNGPDLEPRGEDPSYPPAEPAYPHPLSTLLAPPSPPQPVPGCHLQPLIHQSFRKWLLPSCLP